MRVLLMRRGVAVDELGASSQPCDEVSTAPQFGRTTTAAEMLLIVTRRALRVTEERVTWAPSRLTVATVPGTQLRGTILSSSQSDKAA
jgi:hypothetical protein